MKDYVLTDPDTRLIVGDCVQQMKELKKENRVFDLVFADPPFNQGENYGTCQDNLPEEDYVSWTSRWLLTAANLLREGGSFWVNCPDHIAAEIVVIFFSMTHWRAQQACQYKNEHRAIALHSPGPIVVLAIISVFHNS